VIIGKSKKEGGGGSAAYRTRFYRAGFDRQKHTIRASAGAKTTKFPQQPEHFSSIMSTRFVIVISSIHLVHQKRRI
jgi:hypothetical protein